MRESTIRLIVLITVVIMTIGIPVAVIALAEAHGITIMNLAHMNPLVFIPFAFVYFGWGAVWVVIAITWFLHGSIGLRRFIDEVVTNKGARRAIDILITILILIGAAALIYELIFLPA